MYYDSLKHSDFSDCIFDLGGNDEISSGIPLRQAIENVFAIGTKFPIGDPNEVYDCVCTPPSDNSDSILNWAKYGKSACLVSDFVCSSLFEALRSYLTFSPTQALNGSTVGPDCLKPEHQPNIFLMSVILFGGTYITSVILKDFKNTLFFPSMVS